MHVRFCVIAAGLLWPAVLFAQSPAPAPQSAPATVFRGTTVGVAPLPGLEMPKEDVAAPVRVATAADLERSAAADLSSFLSRRTGGVHLNEIQGNPYQVDLSFRGFTASPLLGTPQGLSVYMDGVRVNQPFGDVVSWDLIPRLALSSATLIPGSNPLFGLNTLGGALSLQTKDGRTARGTSANVSYGSNQRRSMEIEHGGGRADGTLHWYATANLFADDGWRDDSPSDVRQVFAKVGGTRAHVDWALTSSYANNHLLGNGLQEYRWLDRDYRTVYTKPDITDNEATFVNVTLASRRPSLWNWSANAYYRHLGTRTLNADINDDALDQSVYQPGAAERAALAAAGYTGMPASGASAANTPFPSWRCIGNALLRDEPAEKCNGIINRTASRQHQGGMSAQFTHASARDDRRHRLTLGLGIDASGVVFRQSAELGYLNADRSVTGVGAFGDGVTGGVVDGEPFDTRVDLSGRTYTLSGYATDTVDLGERLSVTVSGRFNRTVVTNTDGVLPGGGPGSLDGHQVFQRLNPSAGLSFKPSPLFNLYLGYAEGHRAPTSTELGCADPSMPCKLPNAMAGDPPLKAVVTRTIEAGVRSGPAADTSWSVSLFRAENRDDILFVTSAQSGFGYFSNIGRTRRQGVEVSIDRRLGAATVSASYTFLAATFESAEAMTGTANSTNAEALVGRRGLDGAIEIGAGDQMPLVPRHVFKASADVDVTERLSASLDVSALSGVYARGNENNRHQPDGVYYLGPGRTNGYVVANGVVRYRMGVHAQLFVEVRNLLDRRYATAAQLGPLGFTTQGTFIARSLPAVGTAFPVPQSTFLAPGAPRAFQLGLRLRF